MAFAPGKAKLAFPTTKENIVYLRENHRRIYSDSRYPGDVLHFVLTALVRADQDPQAHGRAADRMRFVQERTNSRDHIAFRSIESVLENFSYVSEKPTEPFDLGAGTYWNALRNKMDARPRMEIVDDPFAYWKQFIRPTALGVGTPPSTTSKRDLFVAGVRSAHSSANGLIEGVRATLDNESVMTYHELVSPNERRSPFNWKVASVDTLRQLEAVLRKGRRGMTRNQLRYRPLHELSEEALKDALDYLVKSGQVRQQADLYVWVKEKPAARRVVSP